MEWNLDVPKFDQEMFGVIKRGKGKNISIVGIHTYLHSIVFL